MMLIGTIIIKINVPSLLLVPSATNAIRSRLGITLRSFRPFASKLLCEIGVTGPASVSLVVLDELRNVLAFRSVGAVQPSCIQTLRGHQTGSIVSQLHSDAADGVDTLGDDLVTLQVLQIATCSRLVYQ